MARRGSAPPVIATRRKSRSTMMTSAAGVMPARPSRVAISPSVTSPAPPRLGSSGCWMISWSKVRA